MQDEVGESVRHCPLCEGDRALRLHFQRFVLVEGHPLREGYWVASCIMCGFVFADVAASQADFDRFYANQSKYADSNTSTGGGDSPHDVQRLTGFASRISHWIPSRNARIIDIGCANGGLLVALRQLGYSNLLGVDPSPDCIAKLRHQGIAGLAATLDRLPADVNSFDAVILSHVLEHVLDLRQFGQILGRLLAAGGAIVAEVPDAARYIDSLVAPFQEFNTEHINHFSAKGLQHYMQRMGLTPWDQYADFLPTATLSYPVVGGIYVCGRPPQVLPATDIELLPRIRQYIQASRIAMDNINQRLQAGLSQSKGVLVWGAGQLTMKLLAETVLGQANIEAFIDSNPVNQGKHIRGVPILQPQRAADYDCPIVVASTLHQNAIVEQIRNRLTLDNPLILLS